MSMEDLFLNELAELAEKTHWDYRTLMKMDPAEIRLFVAIFRGRDSAARLLYPLHSSK